MKYLVCLLLCFSLLNADEEEVPVVILGGGVGAMTSATYLARAGITPLVITGPFPGGAINYSHSIQNWPGEIDIPGMALGDKIQKQAQLNGVVFLPEVVVGVDFTKKPYVIMTKEYFQKEQRIKKIKAHSVIIALGASPNFLGIPGELGENGYFLRGVYNCAVCDGGFYKDKTVAVVGGGDSALTEAHYLSNIAKKVYIIVRKGQFRTVEEQRKRAILSRPNIEVMYNTSVQEIKGNGTKMTHLILNNRSELAVDGMFLAIGSTPNTKLFQNQLELDAKGYVVLKHFQETSLPGIYALGDVSDYEFKQAVTAAGDAAKAALQAQKYLTTYSPQVKKSSSVAAMGPPRTIEISSAQHFNAKLKDSPTPSFVYFYSTHCGPCRAFSLLYDSWSREYEGKIQFLKVNVDTNTELDTLYQIQAVPTLLIMDGKGNLVRKSIGTSDVPEINSRLEPMKDKTAISSETFR